MMNIIIYKIIQKEDVNHMEVKNHQLSQLLMMLYSSNLQVISKEMM